MSWDRDDEPFGTNRRSELRGGGARDDGRLRGFLARPGAGARGATPAQPLPIRRRRRRTPCPDRASSILSAAGSMTARSTSNPIYKARRASINLPIRRATLQGRDRRRHRATEHPYCAGARALCGSGKRPGLQRGSDRSVPKQGVYDRQEPRYPIGAEMPGAGLAPRPRAQRWRMSDRDIRDACALPIAGQGIDRGKAALLSKGNVARMSEAICANPGFRCRSSGLRSVLDSTSFLCSNDSIPSGIGAFP